MSASNRKNITARYRPSLTAIHIAHIVSVLSSEVPLSEDSKEVLKVLRPFLTKIELDAVVPAFTAGERLSTMELLGEGSISSNVPALSKKQCYELWRAGETISEDQIISAKDYAYLNDLMSASEEQEYESEIDALEQKLRNEV